MTERYNSMTWDIEKYIEDDYAAGIAELEDFRHECLLPCFDPWSDGVQLHLTQTTITRGLLKRMVDFLNLPLAKDPTGSGNEEFRWIEITFEACEFADDDLEWNEEDCCTLDEMISFSSALANRTLCLAFTESDELLSCFLSTSHVDFVGELLYIEQRECPSPVEYERLGNLIARSVHLTNLHLDIPLDDGVYLLFEGLANAVNLQGLSLHDTYLRENNQVDLLVGSSNGPLIRLLENPQNRLKELHLYRLGLKDQHLITISQLLPTSNIHEFDFSGNLIECEGMLEFTRQLGRMPSLWRVGCRSNPWEESETTRNAVGAALLQGVMESTSIVYIDSCHEITLIRYYLVLNAAGRRLLTSLQPIPVGLWHLVLARAGNRDEYSALNAVYLFLRHCPEIVSFRGRPNRNHLSRKRTRAYIYG